MPISFNTFYDYCKNLGDVKRIIDVIFLERWFYD